ncbi:MAG TPA: phosphate ABC transporter ATP-binding protein [Thermoanaerobaculia bacterium]|nr:phosphate ABC transporter ATP-binding protein [Thermoanaerobaculia bacterium]
MVDPAKAAASPSALEARGFGVGNGARDLIRGVDLKVESRSVLCLVGPSGAGKTTLLRGLNRLIDLAPDLHRIGEVLLHGRSIYGRGVDGDSVRRRIGILFQQPVVFPGSVADNVLFGLRHGGLARRRELPERLERAIREAALWEEVKDRLAEPAASLSVGQQQRLCLARALAVEPEVLLLDEPTSALDPRSTEAIEERIRALRETRAIVLVTHDIRQAERTADVLACIDRREGAGTVIECGACRDLLSRPQSLELARFLDSSLAGDPRPLRFPAETATADLLAVVET